MNLSLTYILADDDAMYREIILQQLSIIPNIECLAVCENAIKAKEILQTIQPDLLMLDVEMPGLSGVELAKSLIKLPLIIFISSHQSYAAEAFEVDAIDYLVKPVSIERLMRTIDKARNLVEMKKAITLHDGFKLDGNDSFFIKDKSTFIRIRNSEVLYIESLGDFVSIYLENGQKKIALVTLKNIEQQLPTHDFIRIARTYIINKQKISAIDNNTVSIGKIQLGIGKTYTETVMQSVIGNITIKRYL